MNRGAFDHALRATAISPSTTLSRFISPPYARNSN